MAALKKPLCSLSARMGTLIYLYLCLGKSVWSILFIFMNDSLYEQFLRDNSYFYYPAVFFALIGSLIFLANIVSISGNKPSMFLLSMAIAFSILHAMYSVVSVFRCAINGVFNDFLNVLVGMREGKYPSVLKIVCISMVIDVYILAYAVLVFLIYMIELKIDASEVSRVQTYIERNRANSSKHYIYNL